jgi:hypothetical protein
MATSTPASLDQGKKLLDLVQKCTTEQLQNILTNGDLVKLMFDAPLKDVDRTAFSALLTPPRAPIAWRPVYQYASNRVEQATWLGSHQDPDHRVRSYPRRPPRPASPDWHQPVARPRPPVQLGGSDGLPASRSRSTRREVHPVRRCAASLVLPWKRADWWAQAHRRTTRLGNPLESHRRYGSERGSQYREAAAWPRIGLVAGAQSTGLRGHQLRNHPWPHSSWVGRRLRQRAALRARLGRGLRLRLLGRRHVVRLLCGCLQGVTRILVPQCPGGSCGFCPWSSRRPARLTSRKSIGLFHLVLYLRTMVIACMFMDMRHLV